MIENLITGGSGFLGQHLVEKIKGNILELSHNEILPFITHKFKTLYFLSAYGNMAKHANHYEMVMANVTKLMWLTWKADGFVIYVSSSSVSLPVQTSYSHTKRAAEEILLALPEVKSCIVRPFSITGVGEQKEHLIPTLIRSCMEGEEIYFDPSPVHDFVDVEDVCDGLIKIAERQATGLVEFGNGFPYTNQAVRELVERHCGKPANIREEKKLREYDNADWYCKTFHPAWTPKKNLDKSISEMVQAYKITKDQYE